MSYCPACQAEFVQGTVVCTNCGRPRASAAALPVGRTAVRGSAEIPAVSGGVAQGSPLAAETVVVGHPYLGKTLGSYKLHKILGDGGMGTVYLAEHVKLERKVALKMLHPNLAGNPDAVRRFFDEARAVNKIFHEHIVEITDFVENQGGDNYFIMELLRGAPLSETLELEGVGALQLSRAIGIGVQICSALVAAHDAGIVHRDLKPENIFLSERGGQKDYVKLLDFGIAKLLDIEDGPELQKTAAGVIMGTPEYMSPEQARGREVHKSTDVYSFGVILYELCVGRKPFEEEDFGGYVMAHTTIPPTAPSKASRSLQRIPKPLEALIVQCLAKEPADRPPIAKVEQRLREIASSFSAQLERFDISKRVVPKASKRTLLIGAGVLVAAAILALVVLGGANKTVAKDVPAAVAPAEVAPSTPEPRPEAREASEVPEVRKVKLDFRSRPKGAEVFASGSDVPLGKTPFATTIESSEATVDFEFRKEGYEPLIKAVAIEGNPRLVVALTRRKKDENKRRRKRKRKSEPDLDQGDVLDPFD